MSTPLVGEKCRVVLPVTQDLFDRVADPMAHIAQRVTEAFDRACSKHGFTATDQRLIWQGTAGEAKHQGIDVPPVSNELGEHMLIFVYEATAA